MRTRRLLLLIGAVGVVAIGMWAVGLMGGLRPAPAADPGCAPIEGSAGPVPGMPCAHVATLVGQNHGYLAPGGQADGTLFGSDRWGIDSNQGSRLPVAVIGDTVVASGVPWARVYVPSSPGSGGDADVFTWLPLAVAGELRIVDIRASECPATRDNPSTLGVLDPITRARCLGAGSFTITGRSGRQAAPVAYDVEPQWLSGWSGDPAGFSIRADPFGEPIDVQQHGGALPPPGFVIELTAHVGDAAAHDCRRTRTSETSPVEAREDSVVWCLTRIVADRWNAVLGPEDRPIDPRNPQLHRHDPLGACAGVHMGVLRFRLDARELDPVWLEGEGGRRVIPSFTSAFRPVFQPDLVLVDGSGSVVVRDGLEVDTNANLAGHTICPTGEWVSFG